MDKVIRYHQWIKQAICKSPYYVYGSTGPEVETLFFCDEAQHCYHLLDLGWRGKERVNNTILLVRIKNEKIWIEEDWTEEGITDELLRSGVPKEDIVLAFHPPNLRSYTEFAVT